MPAFGSRIRPVLPGMYIETFDFESNLRGYVGTKLMPLVPVDKNEGSYYRLTKEHLLQKRPDTKINDEGNFREVSFKWDYSGYNTIDRGLEFRLTDRLKGIHGNDIAIEATGAKLLNAMLAEEHEEDVIALVNAETPTAASAVWTTTSTDIIGDVSNAISRLRTKLIPIDPAGFKLVVDWSVWKAMKKNVGILDTFGSQERKDGMTATQARIADILDVGEIVIANSFKNGVPEGGTPSYSGLWTATKAALVCTGTGTGPTDVRWGNTLHWTEAGGAPARFYRYKKENGTADVMRQRIDRTEHIVVSGAIEVISAVAA